ncbi:MAG TPA: DUF2752 domain-containing protein [Saprospiraceae bacterium]|nr:DUF2752 domain-containing protein [Saprospiraceae bacterium]HMQ84260.1 DUF2752 domain-containing protein [Saprospiraceae bacterium]
MKGKTRRKGWISSRLNLNSKPWVLTRLAFLIILPIVLLALPADYFDSGRAVCLSRVIFDVECFACGMTRAVMHFIHFEFNEAVYHNVLVLPVAPLLLFLWVKWLWTDWKRWRAFQSPIPA